MNSRRQLGQAIEAHVGRLLECQGWTIVARNWRGQAGEIDLVALDLDVLVIVEVKGRRGATRGHAEEAVGSQKAERLLRLGEEFVAAHPEHEHRFWRVDIVAVTLDQHGAVYRLSHLKNACGH